MIIAECIICTVVKAVRDSVATRNRAVKDTASLCSVHDCVLWCAIFEWTSRAV